MRLCRLDLRDLSRADNGSEEVLPHGARLVGVKVSDELEVVGQSARHGLAVELVAEPAAPVDPVPAGLVPQVLVVVRVDQDVVLAGPLVTHFVGQEGGGDVEVTAVTHHVKPPEWSGSVGGGGGFGTP